jgi:hypothetical protein
LLSVNDTSSCSSSSLFLVQKVRARYASHPSESETLESLVENEFKTEKKRTASEGLMWLLRGLNFTGQAMQNAQANPSEELSAAFTKSYDNTLKKFHNFVVKGIFSVSRPRPHLRNNT